jgi:uncharacterized protein
MPKSSKSFLFPDVNVWVALTYQGHVHHAAAKKWFDSLDEDARLCFCRFTQLSFLRLLTTEALMGAAEVMSQVEAWQTYDRWLEDSRVSLIDEPSGLESIFRSLSRARRPTPKDWADSYLIAFASVSDLSLVTFDHAFKGRARELILLKP